VQEIGGALCVSGREDGALVGLGGELGTSTRWGSRESRRRGMEQEKRLDGQRHAGDPVGDASRAVAAAAG
jgi:hypothetical protein